MSAPKEDDLWAAIEAYYKGNISLDLFTIVARNVDPEWILNALYAHMKARQDGGADEPPPRL